MAATLGFPFTSAQWKELERQAMIYKYMVASVPVPPHLLLPIAPNLSADPSSSSHSPLGGGSIFNPKFANNKDPEPGRCKRTDGKKWRCSRDVAPHQKYCERHMHRSPRSRKPVEVHVPLNNKKRGRLHQGGSLPTPEALPNPTVKAGASSPQLLGSTIPPNENPLLLDTKTVQHLSASSYSEPNRSLDWIMEGEQQWQHLMQTSIGLATGGSIYNTNVSVFHQDYPEEPLNLISYTDFGASEDIHHNGECNLFLNHPDLVETPRGFIDAWSNDNPNKDDNNNNESSVSSHGNISPSSLTLSMAMAVGNAISDEMAPIQMGLGVPDTDSQKPQVSNWSSPVSWAASSAPGGPLAEVLLPSTVAISLDPVASPIPNSPPATTVSSPSGVLHRTMLSLSDSSVCNSPTLAVSTATPEIVAFQWLS